MRCDEEISGIIRTRPKPPPALLPATRVSRHECFGCAVAWIYKHDVSWFTSWRVDRKEYQGLCEDFGDRMRRSALEEKELAWPEFGLRRWVLHPKGPAPRQDVKIFVAAYMIMGRGRPIDPKTRALAASRSVKYLSTSSVAAVSGNVLAIANTSNRPVDALLSSVIDLSEFMRCGDIG